jgi:hypothetical protein
MFPIQVRYVKIASVFRKDFPLDVLSLSGIMSREKDRGDKMTTRSSLIMTMEMQSRRNPWGVLLLSSAT